MSKGFVSTAEAAYIHLLLSDADPENKKDGLQRICRLYATGLTLQYPHTVRQTLNGMLYSGSQKVVRWALNAISVCGRRVDNLAAVQDSLRKYQTDPEILVCGVAALFSLCTPDEVRNILVRLRIPLEGPVLAAAARFSLDHRMDLAKRKINPDKATPLELRMGTLLVGLNIAPANLFTSRLSNEKIIGALNQHDDPVVAQYSVWAIAESPALGLNNLGISLKDIESFPPNVRAWLYRLIGADAATAKRNLDSIVFGSMDRDAEARAGLASSLKGVFFDGLDETVFSWFPDEGVVPIRHRLLEHMSASADKCPAYETPVKEHYSSAGPILRGRLEVAAQRTKMYGKLRRISIDAEQASLFGAQGEMNIVVTQNINTAGGSIGAVVGKGSVSSASIQAVTQMNGSPELREVLGRLLDAMTKDGVPSAKQQEGSALVEEVAKAPTKGNIEKLWGWTKLMIETGAVTSEAAHIFPEIVQALHHLIA